MPFAVDIGLLPRPVVALLDQTGSLGGPSIPRPAKLLELGGEFVEPGPKLHLLVLIGAHRFLVMGAALIRLATGRVQLALGLLVSLEELGVRVLQLADFLEEALALVCPLHLRVVKDVDLPLQLVQLLVGLGQLLQLGVLG